MAVTVSKHLLKPGSTLIALAVPRGEILVMPLGVAGLFRPPCLVTEVAYGVMCCGGLLPTTGFSSSRLADPVRGYHPAKEWAVTCGCWSCSCTGACGDYKSAGDNPANRCSFWRGDTKL